MPSPHLRRALLATLALPAAVALPGVASATPQLAQFDLPAAAPSHLIDRYAIVAKGDGLPFSYNLDATMRGSWSAKFPTTLAWNDTYVRQGADLPVGRMTLAPSGTLHLSWRLTGTVQRAGETILVDRTVTQDVPCAPSVGSANAVCHYESPMVGLWKTPGIPNSPYVNLQFRGY